MQSVLILGHYWASTNPLFGLCCALKDECRSGTTGTSWTLYVHRGKRPQVCKPGTVAHKVHNLVFFDAGLADLFGDESEPLIS